MGTSDRSHGDRRPRLTLFDGRCTAIFHIADPASSAKTDGGLRRGKLRIERRNSTAFTAEDAENAEKGRDGGTANSEPESGER